MSPLTIVPADEHPDDDGETFEVRDPAREAQDQAREALDAIRRPASEYLHLPWRALDEVADGIPPGDVWYVGGFSGDGKTTLLTSLTLDGVAAGWQVYYLGLESRANVIRTHFACKSLGLDAGDLLTGAYLQWADHEAVRERVRLELKRQASAEMAHALRVSEAPSLDARVVRTEFARAAAYGATVVIIDHVDHLASARDMKVLSDEVNATILEMTQELGVVSIVASQLNLDTIRGNRAARHLPPAENCWKYGNKKREVASGMLAVYRPLRIAGLQKGELQAFKDGELAARDVCEPNTMAVVCTKHRLRNHESRRALLGVKAGRVVPKDPGLPWSLR